MTMSTHAAVGALIGFSIGNPILGFVIGFVSHLILDIVPHGDSKISENLRVFKKKKGAMTYGTIDAIIAIYIILILTPIPKEYSQIAFSAAIAGSILPDLLVGLYDLTKSKYLKPFNDLHFYFHDLLVKNHKDIKLPYALIGQAVFILILLNSV